MMQSQKPTSTTAFMSSPVKAPAPTPSQPPDDSVGCRDACGNRTPAPEVAGWQYLEITKQWRCPTCMRALRLANLFNEP
jgi:hypothetical protein